MRTCRGCVRDLPLEQFHRKLDGHAARCKECASSKKKAVREADPEHVRALERARVDANRATRQASQRRHYAQNRDQRIAGSRAWARANAEQYREYQRKYYVQNAARICARAEAWRLAHPVESRQHRSLATMRRRARARALPSEKFTVQDVWARDAPDGQATCYLCVKPLTIGEAEIEHLIPLAARADDLAAWGLDNNPGTVLVNTGLAHHACNASKGARILPLAVERYQANLAA